MQKFYTLFFSAVFLFIAEFTLVLAQENTNQESKKQEQNPSDSEKVQILPDTDFDFNFDNEDNFNINFSFHKEEQKPDWTYLPEKPYISLFWGNSVLKNKDFNNLNFNDNNQVYLGLGYYHRKEHNKSLLTKTSVSEFYISNFDEFGNTSNNDNNKIKTKNWSAGFDWGKGYGYKFSNYLGLNFIFKEGLNWSYMQFNPNNYISPVNSSDTINFNTYNEALRFGEHFESVASIEVLKYFAISASYERINVYPRHLFWYWAGGKIIEEAGQGLLTEFINEIQKYSPEFTPIFNILLKTGLSYGIYELRRKNMNWPFDTAPPFTFENVKFGMTFIF
jgi:hypothetical protein